MSYNISPNQPIFFQANRVWRCYTGGCLLDRFVGNPDPSDGHVPEDWIASTVSAMNSTRSQGPMEGLARISLPDGTPGPLLKDLLREHSTEFLGSNDTSGELSLLCKYLDSAVRLPIQCHPDIPFAQKHYNSNRGKTESWVILGTRPIDGAEPYLLMGFKPGIRREGFARAVYDQDIPALESMLHRFPARVGDVWLIPGRFPHAIGSGVFLLEVQEPSDWVVQPEYRCADTELTPQDMWGPLTPELGLECFSYIGETMEEISARCLKLPRPVLSTEEGEVARIIGPESTDCFSLDRITVHRDIRVTCETPYHIGVVVSGDGVIEADGEAVPISQGSTYLAPNGVREVSYRSYSSPLVIYRCGPGSTTRTSDL